MTAVLAAIAAWIGDTAARIAIRIGAGAQLAAAIAEAWTTAEPESPAIWTWNDEPVPLPADHRPSWAHDVPPPRPIDPFAEIRDASEADIKARLRAICRAQSAIQQGEQSN